MACDFISISDAAKANGVPPKLVSDLFFRGILDRDRCTRIAGRTLIPRDYARAVVGPELRRRGYATKGGARDNV
jgi:hypothetical protein